MSRRRPRRILDHALESHPAVLAWQAVEPRGAVPERIDVFSDSSPWLLVALAGAGPDGSTVFAKRRPATLAAVERTVYEQILPGLQVSAPHCYGCVADGEFVWFLLQAVDGVPYNESDPDHLAMAGRFVAGLHMVTTARRGTPVLPDAGPQRYLKHLLAARARLQECLLSSHALDNVARHTLERVVGLLDRVETGWHAVGARCEDAPLVLVHGDFRPKNVFVRHDGGGLVAFDWETAGWGPPPADLTKTDVATYWRTVCDVWGTVSLDTVLAWEWVGRLFQALAAIDWSSANLALEATADQAESISNVQVLGEGLSEVWTRA